MSLDARDRARLRRIEAELEATDRVLARQFRRWRPSSGPAPAGPGWSVAPRWMLVVFLVGFTSWIAGPAVGVAVTVLTCWRPAWRRVRHGRDQHRDRVQGRDGRGSRGSS